MLFLLVYSTKHARDSCMYIYLYLSAVWCNVFCTRAVNTLGLGPITLLVDLRLTQRLSTLLRVCVASENVCLQETKQYNQSMNYWTLAKALRGPITIDNHTAIRWTGIRIRSADLPLWTYWCKLNSSSHCSRLFVTHERKSQSVQFLCTCSLGQKVKGQCHQAS